MFAVLSFRTAIRLSTVFLANRLTDFCDYKVDFTVQRILYHLIETIALFRVSRRNTLIRIHKNEVPIRALLDILGVVIDLRIRKHPLKG